MREEAPEIVPTHSPADYMEDHTNSCRLAVTAAFARGMPNFARSIRYAHGGSGGDDLSLAAAWQSRRAWEGPCGRAFVDICAT